MNAVEQRRERQRQYMTVRRKTHPEEIKAIQQRYYKNNRQKALAKSAAWRVANPERQRSSTRNSKLKRQYGLTAKQVDEMRLQQGDACAICRRPFVGSVCVDHDHVTGVTRELLCSNCNTAIGLFKESAEYMTSAITYLRKHQRQGE